MRVVVIITYLKFHFVSPSLLRHKKMNEYYLLCYMCALIELNCPLVGHALKFGFHHFANLCPQHVKNYVQSLSQPVLMG